MTDELQKDGMSFTSNGGEVPKKTVEKSRDEMMKIATTFAEFLTGKGFIKRVGITGSLARGKENPSDIDFVIMIDDSKALEYVSDEIRRNSFPKYESEVLGIDDKWSPIFFMYVCDVEEMQIAIISNNPSEAYIHKMTSTMIDPNYLLNLDQDLLIFTPEKKVFEKQEVFTSEAKKAIKEAVFDILKKVKDNDEYLDRLEKSYSHQRRIARAKISQSIPSSK